MDWQGGFGPIADMEGRIGVWNEVIEDFNLFRVSLSA